MTALRVSSSKVLGTHALLEMILGESRPGAAKATAQPTFAYGYHLESRNSSSVQTWLGRIYCARKNKE
jgi:hypothetical protein